MSDFHVWCLVSIANKLWCGRRRRLTCVFKWNNVFYGPLKLSCNEQLAAKRAGLRNQLDCVKKASLVFNPTIVESLSIALLPREVDARELACPYTRATGPLTSTTNNTIFVMMGNAIHVPFARIDEELLVCRHVDFEAFLQDPRILERLASAYYSLVAVVKYREVAVRPLFAEEVRFSPFLVLVGRNQSAYSSSHNGCGANVNVQLGLRQDRDGLFF